MNKGKLNVYTNFIQHCTYFKSLCTVLWSHILSRHRWASSVCSIHGSGVVWPVVVGSVVVRSLIRVVFLLYRTVSGPVSRALALVANIVLFLGRLRTFGSKMSLFIAIVTYTQLRLFLEYAIR